MAPLSKKVLRRLEEEHLQSIEELAAANHDLGQRVLRQGVDAVYDRDADVLILTVGKSQGAVTESIDNALYFRADPESLKIVGVELYRFREHMTADSPMLRFCLNLMQVAGCLQLSVQSRETEASSEDLVLDIRRLARA